MLIDNKLLYLIVLKYNHPRRVIEQILKTIVQIPTNYVLKHGIEKKIENTKMSLKVGLG
jgi:putative flippase GtrA